MRQRDAERLMNRAIKAYRQGSDSYQSIMDDASIKLSEEQWEELCRRLDEADYLPALPMSPQEEQAHLEARVARARVELEEATKELYAFYGRKHSRKKERSS
jgi:hypothetical protein